MPNPRSNNTMDAVKEQLVSKHSRQESAKAELEEQQRRIAEDQRLGAQQEVVRIIHQRDADHAADEEQARRLSQPHFVPPSIEQVLKTVQEQVVRLVTSRQVIAAMEHEREEQVAHERLYTVLDQLLSTTSRREASKLAEAEQQRRVRLALGEEVARKAGQQPTANLTPSGIPEDIQRGMDAVREDLVRAFNAFLADTAETEEQVRRITEERMHDVHDELLRLARISQVNLAELEEQTQRVVEDRKRTLHRELESRMNQKQTASLEEEERTRRVQEDRHATMLEQLLHRADARTANQAARSALYEKMATEDADMKRDHSQLMEAIRSAVSKRDAIKNATDEQK
jgi:hypothetical protein